MMGSTIMGQGASVRKLTQAFEGPTSKSRTETSPRRLSTPPHHNTTASPVAAGQKSNAVAALSSNSDLSTLSPKSSTGVSRGQSMRPTISQNAASRASSPVSREFVQYKPGGPAPTAIPLRGPIRWSSPVEGEGALITPGPTPGPTPVKKKQLPMFGPTSVIPFAQNPEVRKNE